MPVRLRGRNAATRSGYGFHPGKYEEASEIATGTLFFLEFFVKKSTNGAAGCDLCGAPETVKCAFFRRVSVLAACPPGSERETLVPTLRVGMPCRRSASRIYKIRSLGSARRNL